MKLRSALLVACMIVVPLLAMFSHKISSATRAAARQQLWDPLVDTAAAALGLPLVDRKPPVPPPTPSSIAPDSSAGLTPAGEFPPADQKTDADHPMPDIVPRFHGPADAAGPLASATIPLTDGQAQPGDRVIVDPIPTPPTRDGLTDAAAPREPPRSLPGTPDAQPMARLDGLGTAGGERDLLESRLRSLGATSIEWTPAQGGDGLHRCTCRIPAEPTGQLHRVFQASATNPVTALDSLVGQVTAWSMRVRPDNGPRGAAATSDPVVR